MSTLPVWVILFIGTNLVLGEELCEGHACEQPDETGLLQFSEAYKSHSSKVVAQHVKHSQKCTPGAGAITDYDCDGDCNEDCKNSGFWSSKCENQPMCGYKYKFGNIHFGCQCMPCFDQPGTAAANEDIVKGDYSPYFGRWKNWVGFHTTCAPWLLPKNDAELKRLLAYAASQGYKVRPSGATHSAAPLVTDSNSRDVLVISLAEYVAPGDWEYKLIESADGAKVMVNAGWSQLDLYAKIRPNPKNYFIPTNTAGYFFQLGGIVANTVHGGSYQRGFLHNYVTRMRVITSDGTIKIIDEEDDLRYWRNSYGLLGLILGVEFQLEARPKFQMFTKTRELSSWNSEEFWKFMRIDAEMNDTGVTVPGATGTRKGFAGEYFVDLVSDKVTMQVISTKVNENADEPDIPDTAPSNIEENYNSLKHSSVTRTDGKDLDYAESTRIDGVPQVSPLGFLGLNDILSELKFLPIDIAMIKTTLWQIPKLVEDAGEKLNDGHFALKAPDTYIGAFFIEADKAFAAFDYLRSVQRHNTSGWNQPGEYRWVKVTGKAVLEPVPPGFYFTTEVLAFPGTQSSQQDFYKRFKQVEEYWVNTLGGKPHIGKLFGFDNVDGTDKVMPFQHSITCKVYSAAQKADFEAYRQNEDPIGMFNYGFGTQLLQAC